MNTDQRTDTDPIAVTLGCVRDALRSLGLVDIDLITSVRIEPRRIAVTRRRLDENGHQVAAGDYIATTQTVIAVRDEEDETEDECDA